MKKYKVTMTVTADEFLSVFKNLFGSSIAFEVDEIESGSPAKDVSAPPKATRKRTSKVNEAILDALDKGPTDASGLRASLEKAGLSPNSLSTGLALLQKNGAIQRDGHGTYYLSAHEGVAA